MPGYIAAAAIAAVAWLILLGGEPESWVVGLPCVVLCAWFSRSVLPARRLGGSPLGWLRLAPYFLWNSMAGGWDVARRVMLPQLAVNPGYVDFRLGIPAGPARSFFVQFIGLLPGTLGAWLEHDCLRVHVLNLDADHERALRTAEARVAAAFAVEPAS
jgi:multicomponent Na+:H+ antiporter subunit E